MNWKRAFGRSGGLGKLQDLGLLGEETLTDEKKNDRMISWMSLASFGWTLFSDKGSNDFYQLLPDTLALVREAARIEHPHREFASVPDYIEHVSRCAALPKDLR
ncbi:hypothetical protein ACN28I_15260 [Archangium gephyra]|uniref:hypothetical protein n=1 Tax=Archangium gephyra TaxID=48 RepID=UPI003B82B03D